MTNITDYKRNSMQTVLGSSVNNIDTLEIAYLQAAGATSNNVNDAWYEVFVLGGATSLNWNTAADQWLTALGATGDGLPAKWYWFWITNGGVIGGGIGNLIDDTVSWFPLEEPSGNFASAVGAKILAPVSVTRPAGKVGNGAGMSGSGFMNGGTSSGFQGGARDWTYAQWFNVTSYSGDMVLANVGTGGTPATNDWMIYINSGSGIFTFYLGVGTGWQSLDASSFGAVPTGVWHQILIEYVNSTQTMGVSINNGTLDTKTITGTPNTTGGNLFIGKWSSGNGFRGVVDEPTFSAGIWDSTAKAAYYNDGDGITYPV